MTRSTPYLTAKVYWDALSPDIDIRPGLEGITSLSEITPDVRVIEESRLIKTPTLRDGILNCCVDQNRKLDADLNFILTRRKLVKKKDIWSPEVSRATPKLSSAIIGYSLYGNKVGCRRLSYVNIADKERADEIVLHEAAHLLDLGDLTLAEDPQHCADERCLLYPLVNDEEQSNFCDPCEDQIVNNAHMLRMAKYGEYALARNAVFDPRKRY